MPLRDYTFTIPRRMTGHTVKMAHLFNAAMGGVQRTDAAMVDSRHVCYFNAFDTWNGSAVDDKWYKTSGDAVGAADTTSYATQDRGVNVTLGSGDAAVKLTLRSATALFTLPNLRKQLHFRFKINSTNDYDAALAASFRIGIAHSAGVPTTNNYAEYKFNNANHFYHSDGWVELTWNMVRGAAQIGSNLNVDGPLACNCIFLWVDDQETNDVTVLDWTFDSLWITDEQTLGADNGCVVLMLDDVLAVSGSHPHAVGLAKIAESYKQRLVFPVEIGKIGSTTTVGWEELARFSRAGHELIFHDDAVVTGWSEQQNYDRFRTLLDVWYQEAPRYGLVNWQRGMRWCIPRGNILTPNYLAAARRVGMTPVGPLGSGPTTSLDNLWPQMAPSLYRQELQNGQFGASQRFRVLSLAAKQYGAVACWYSHYCYVSGHGTQPNEDEWDADLAYMATNDIRVVTLSELFDNILPNELTWT